MADLGDQLGDIFRRLEAIETSVQLNRITADGGMVILNAERSAPAFRVGPGGPVFPLFASAWQRDATMGYSADGWASIDEAQSAGNFYAHWSAVVSLTNPTARMYCRYRTTDTAVGSVRLTAVATNARDGYVPSGTTVCETWTGLSGDGATGFSGLGIGIGLTEEVEVPDAIWTPNSDPVGTVAKLYIEMAVTAGTGKLELVPIEPVYCVD